MATPLSQDTQSKGKKFLDGYKSKVEEAISKLQDYRKAKDPLLTGQTGMTIIDNRDNYV